MKQVKIKTRDYQIVELLGTKEEEMEKYKLKQKEKEKNA